MKTYPKNHPSTLRRNLRSRVGFTLVEVMIATVLSAVVLGGACSSIIALARGSQSLINYSEMNTESRFAFEDLGRNLRSASSVEAVSEDQFQITRLRSDGSDEALVYAFDPSTETLTMTNLSTGESDVLLHDVNSLTLNYYTLRHADTSNPLEVKHIQLEAELRRDVLGIANRNYIISARFMLRNHRVSN